jgi:hypothetical protein
MGCIKALIGGRRGETPSVRGYSVRGYSVRGYSVRGYSVRGTPSVRDGFDRLQEEIPLTQ